MCKTIAISMAKGGVGKSITAVNLCSAIALSGKKVLLVDCDPQVGNATLAMGYSSRNLEYTIANIISSFLDTGTVNYLDEVRMCKTNNFHLLPSNTRLEVVQNRLIMENSNNDILSNNTIPSHQVLREILRTLEKEYDYIILDCPPSISMLTKNALVAANSVIIPMGPHFESYESLINIIDVFNRIQANWNPNLKLEGILLTKDQGNTNLCREIRGYVNDNYGSVAHIYKLSIPLTIKIAETFGVGNSIFEHEPGSDAAIAYEQLAKEVMLNG